MTGTLTHRQEAATAHVQLVYPHFLLCLSHCSDKFWKKIFLDLAHGKPPHGVFFSRQTYLNCKFRGRMFSVNIVERDARDLFEDVVNLLRNRAGVMPVSDRVAASGHDAGSAVSLRDNWSEIRKKTVRTQLFELFVLDSQREHGLSWEQAVRFLSLIQLYLVCKIITTKDVTYRGGRITSVDGISLFRGGFRFDRPFEGAVVDDVDAKKKEPSSGRTVADLWKKGALLPVGKRSSAV